MKYTKFILKSVCWLAATIGGSMAIFLSFGISDLSYISASPETRAVLMFGLFFGLMFGFIPEVFTSSKNKGGNEVAADPK